MLKPVRWFFIINIMCDSTTQLNSRTEYELNLQKLKSIHHSKCIFTVNPPVSDLLLRFNDKGSLLGEFTCNGHHQGYDHMVHGGIIAAIIDAAMVQCLMGHGIVAYTADMSIRYCKPVMIGLQAMLEASVETVKLGLLYMMRCEILQNNKLVVRATGKFFKAK